MNLIGLADAEAPVAGATAACRRWDPRLYQIATLAGLLAYGIWWLDLKVQPANAVATGESKPDTRKWWQKLYGEELTSP